jgi:hypothetical protein
MDFGAGFARHSGESRNPASRMIVVPAEAGIHSVFAVVVACEEQRRFVRYAAEFISFDKRQKKRTKEKRFPRRSSPRVSLLSGFFDSPSMARSKNGAHPCAPPSGSPAGDGVQAFLEAKGEAKPSKAPLLLLAAKNLCEPRCA